MQQYTKNMHHVNGHANSHAATDPTVQILTVFLYTSRLLHLIFVLIEYIFDTRSCLRSHGTDV